VHIEDVLPEPITHGSQPTEGRTMTRFLKTDETPAEG
jgi:hypothetical protein